MATIIKTKNSTTAATAPTGLVQGELAVNITDKKLYVGDSVGNSIQIAGAGATNVAGGSNTQVQYNSSGSLAGSSGFTYSSTSGLSSNGLTLGVNTTLYNTDTSLSYYGSSNFVYLNGIANGGLLLSGDGTRSAAANIAIYGGSASTPNAIAFNTLATERMRLDSSGNLGLGVTPSAWATFKAAQVNYGALASTAGNNTTVTSNAIYDGAWKYVAASTATSYNQDGGTHYWRTAGSGSAGGTITWTQAMTLDASGNLGIGTTSPTAKLDVAGTTAKLTSNTSADVTVQIGPDTPTATRSGRLGFITSSVQKNWYIANNWNTAGGLEFTQTTTTGGSTMGSTPSMTLDSSGNLLVGTTSSTIGSDNGLVAIKRAASGYSMILGSAQTGSISYMIKFTYDNTTGTGQISTTNTTVTYATSSDYRLKENVAPMTGALATVAKLKPVTYNWKLDGSEGQGFIAHELAEVIPEAVVGEKDAVKVIEKEDGTTETVPEYQGIDTSFLVATLTAAIQELKAEFDAYKASHP